MFQLVFKTLKFYFYFPFIQKEELDRMSVSSSDSHLSAHTEADLEIEIHSDLESDSEEFMQGIRYRKKDKALR